MYLLSNQQLETLVRLAGMLCETIPTHFTRNANLQRIGQKTLKLLRNKQPLPAEAYREIKKILRDG